VTTEGTGIPAVQYLRASTDRQQYSIEYQSKRIFQYAERKGFEIVQTFSDEARSGLDLKGRPALRQLLAEVVRGHTAYRAILVYDVSRWGRFQDTDEAAHYEYLCKSAGIPIHYCAEEFSNAGGLSDSLLKALKRFMAGEFSREMSSRSSGGVSQIVRHGFKYGAVPGYALRRMLVGPDRQHKQLLKPGEHKNTSADRVVFVLGPHNEVVVVRKIFRDFAEKGQSISYIVRELNKKQIPWTVGARWTPAIVNRILSHPKYTGTLVFNRTEKKFHDKERPTPRSKWIVVPNAFETIVDRKLFDLAQARLATFIHRRTNEQLLDDLRRLLAVEGRLSLSLWRRAKQRRVLGLASPSTYFSRLGSVRNAYRLIGYEESPKVELIQRTKSQQKSLVHELVNCFPGEIEVLKKQPKWIVVRSGIMVRVQVCRSFRTKRGERRWLVGPGCDGGSITLAATLDEQNSSIEEMFVLPRVPNRRLWARHDGSLLTSGTRLNSLSEFCDAVRAVFNGLGAVNT
jgi:DNA invertase Pin-like site-specific DNA recombinase